MTQDSQNNNTEKPTRRTPNDIQQRVTDAIVAELKKGTAPWQRPWTVNGTSGNPFALPKNLVTGNAYRGINIPLLWIAAGQHGYSTQEWASYQQWRSQKQQVAQGQKGTLIIYYDTFDKETEGGETEKIPFVKASYVFNRCQLEGYAPENEQPAAETPVMERLDRVDHLIKATNARILHDGDSAYYSPSTDTVWMPQDSRFIALGSSTAQQGYYATILHELGHWTGPRLNRDQTGRFRSKSYAHEELVAELASAFLCAELEITDAPRPDHASYIASWLTVLEDNKWAIFQAPGEASKVCDYLKGFENNRTDVTTAQTVPLNPPEAALRA